MCGKMHWDASVDMQLTLGPLKFGINRILIDGWGAQLTGNTSMHRSTWQHICGDIPMRSVFVAI